MPLGSAEIEQIGTYVRANLAEWMEDIVGPQLVGRTARVEDELTFQRELISSRFEAVDKRFEDMHKRFNGMQWMVGGGVVLLATMMSLFRFFG